MDWQLDHLAISAGTLAEGVEYAEDMLGADLSGGGEHPQMGTHNRLISLGEIYLEVIAINPNAPAPLHPRWFDLDGFQGPPRLTNWIVRTPDMTGALALAPPDTGEIMNLKRGDLAWQMAVPGNGKLPYDGAFPAIIHWLGDAHPAARLEDRGLRLVSLSVEHPQAKALQGWLNPLPENPLPDNPLIDIKTGPAKAISAVICGPRGDIVLT